MTHCVSRDTSILTRLAHPGHLTGRGACDWSVIGVMVIDLPTLMFLEMGKPPSHLDWVSQSGSLIG